MDWEKFAMMWGPAVPVAVALLKLLYDAVYVQMPKGFRGIRHVMRIEATAAEARHKEHMRAMRAVFCACKGKRTPAKRRTKRRRPEL